MEKITEIQIIPIKPRDGLVAFASFVYDNSIYLGSIAIITRPNGGFRLVYPTRQGKQNNFNVFHPINKTIAQQINDAVSNKFEEVMNQYARHSRSIT